MRYVCSLSNPGVPGEPKELITSDSALVEKFIKAEDRPGRGVYECINPLTPGANRRNLETVAVLQFIYFDLDLQNIESSREEVIDRLRQLPISLAWVRDSGSGNLHVGIEIKDPPQRGTPEYEYAVAVWKRLAEKLAADPAPVHPAALIRAVGTHNTKNGNNGQCHQLWDGGGPIDITELEEFDGLLTEPLFIRKERERSASNGADTAAGADAADKPPVDIDERLSAMRLKGPGDSAINITRRDVAASMLAQGISVDEIVRVILDATKACVADIPESKNWRWTPADPGREDSEEQLIWESCFNFIVKHPDRFSDRLPDKMYQQFQNVLAAGKRPKLSRNNAGWHIRGYGDRPGAEQSAEESPTEESPEREESVASKPKPSRFTLRPFVPFDLASLPPRQWLYGRHYQRRTVSGTIAPGGFGKTSLCMVEAVAMATGRNLLGELPEERLRVWYHNGEDNIEELNRRLGAICLHYGIPQEELSGWFFMTSGNEVPLRVAKGYSDLKIDQPLIHCINEEIERNKIDIAILDPLVTLHGVPEQDNSKMDMVVRIFATIADTRDCAMELAHHTRKLASGTTDYTVDDMRGASAIKDAVRAARMLNLMREKDATDVGIPEHERTSYFRVDRVKGNNSPPRQAVWRRLVNVELPNTDEVGVVTPWLFPGQDSPSAAMTAVAQAADHVFMQLLVRLTLEGRTVSDRAGANYAPHVFSQESEAKIAKVGKKQLAESMRRLFKDKRIRAESSGEGKHRVHRLVVV